MAQAKYRPGVTLVALVVAWTSTVQVPRLAAQEVDEPPIFAPPPRMKFRDGFLTISQPVTEPEQPDIDRIADEPILPTQPETEFEPGLALGSDSSLTPRLEFSQILQDLRTSGTASADLVIAPPDARGATDTVELLRRSSSAPAVNAQLRSPVALDPRIRGYKYGQIYAQADGQYFTPARQDLDSMLSKIDPGSVQAINVLHGPYTALLGPGFSFFEVITVPTPRYNCFENHFQTGATYINNGEQWYGRETMFGGGPNYGYRLSYGHRVGVDYISGDSTDIPSSYKNRDALAEFGYDLNPDQRLEFGYRRLDQTDTEYPGQFFDVDLLVSEAFNLRLIDEDPFAPWSFMMVQGWYNRTYFNGSTLNSSKRTFHVIDRVEAAINRSNEVTTPPDQLIPGVNSALFQGFTNGDVTSTGGRVATTFGDRDEPNLTVGTDVRYLTQAIDEQFFITSPGDFQTISTNLPRSHLVDPGVFMEVQLLPSSYWTTRLGTRVDWVHTEASQSQLLGIRDGQAYSGSLQGLDQDLLQNDVLFGGFVTNDIALDDVWTTTFGFGYAERPPTLIERYADQLFVAVIQNGFSKVIGDQNLDKERNYQLDVGLIAEYENMRAAARGFHSWINDYITYRANIVNDPTGAQQLFYLNTDLATLSGCEFKGEYDLNRYLTPYASLSYVYGFDQEIDQALPGIYPLQSRVGLWMHSPGAGDRWGLECFTRIVNDQDRVGFIRRAADEVVQIEDQTPGFTTWHLRGYWAMTRNLNLVSGIDNLFDKNYREHFNLRYPPDQGIPATFVFNPGFTPYFSLLWTF